MGFDDRNPQRLALFWGGVILFTAITVVFVRTLERFAADGRELSRLERILLLGECAFGVIAVFVALILSAWVLVWSAKGVGRIAHRIRHRST